MLSLSDTRGAFLAPRYRGAFEEGEVPPRRVRLSSEIQEEGASARFRAPPFPRRRTFGISMEIPPEIWQPAGSRRGWHFFTHRDFLLAVFTSLPATWLAQTPGGDPLPPPWRELWTFGTDHLWSCRIARISGTGENLPERFRSACIENTPGNPSRFSGKVHRAQELLQGGSLPL